MDTRYLNWIEKASTELTALLRTVEGDVALSQRAPRLDAEVRLLLRALGQAVVGRLWATLLGASVAAAKSRGLVVQRRIPWLFYTVFGAVVLEAAYLWRPGESHNPARDVLGLHHRGRSPAVERALVDFGAEESFGHAVERFREHYGFEPGRTTLWRLTCQVAAEAEKVVEKRLAAALPAYEQPSWERPGADQVLVEMDGCELRTATLEPGTPGETSPQGRPKRHREIAWRDVRLGLVRPLGEVEPTVVGGMEPFAQVAEKLFAAGVLRGMTPRSEVGGVADGGIGVREALDARFAGLRFILDRCHLASHLHETAEALGLHDGAAAGWVDERLSRLSRGEAPAVIAELRVQAAPPPRLVRLIGYLERFADAVHYDAFRAQGWPSGSGEVESTHKSVPQKRMKIPGASWHPDTINPMLALRIVRANRWWDDLWPNDQAA